MTRLDARALSVRLGQRRVLSGIDLSFQPGCLTVVVGPSDRTAQLAH